MSQNSGLIQRLGEHAGISSLVFGARNDSNLEQSIFNDPQTLGVDNYTQADLNLCLFLIYFLYLYVFSITYFYK